MAKNFGNPDYDDATETNTSDVPPAAMNNDTAAGFLRDWAKALFVVGILGLTPPFTVGGIVTMIFSGAIWLLSPVVQANNDHAIAVTRRTRGGGGCAWLGTAVVGAAVILIAFVLAVGALEEMVSRGMVAP